MDSRSRLIACHLAGIEPKWKATDADPYAVSVSANLARRQLTTGQKAMIGISIKDHYEQEAKDRKHATQFKNGINNGGANVGATVGKGESRDKISKVVGVGAKAIDKAPKIVLAGIGQPHYIYPATYAGYRYYQETMNSLA